MIVTGAVSIVYDALADLERRHVVLDDKDKADLVKKLMIITCSDHGHAQPVLNIWIFFIYQNFYKDLNKYIF